MFSPQFLIPLQKNRPAHLNLSPSDNSLRARAARTSKFSPDSADDEIRDGREILSEVRGVFNNLFLIRLLSMTAERGFACSRDPQQAPPTFWQINGVGALGSEGFVQQALQRDTDYAYVEPPRQSGCEAWFSGRWRHAAETTICGCEQGFGPAKHLWWEPLAG